MIWCDSVLIEIDGSQGEGGGQMLRTSISLSAILGRPMKIINIRAKRANPGLRPQHITAIRIIADLFHATVENLTLGSDRIRFIPSEQFEGGSMKVDVGTAGSIPMILLAVIPAVSLSGRSLTLEIVGGTDVSASPTFDYLQYVVGPAFRTLGIKFDVDVSKRGYYPKGGGLVHAHIMPCIKPSPVELLDTRKVEPSILSTCCNLPKTVAERQISAALLELEKSGVHCKNYTASLETSLSPGSSILVYSSSDYGPFVGGDCIGERGKRAEIVGTAAATRFLENSIPQVSVDHFLADMLVTPLSLAKGLSRYKTSKVTEHLKTNLRVVSQILGCEYSIENLDGIYVVSIKGV